MMLKRAFVSGVTLGMLIATATALGGSRERTSESTTSTDTVAAPSNVTPPLLNEDGLRPRQPLQKMSLRKPAGPTRLFIKFRDDFKARIAPDNTIQSAISTTGLAADQVQSLNQGVAQIDAIRRNFSLQFVPAFNATLAEMTELTDRAAAISGKAQPDLAGMMYIEGPDATLQTAGEQLQNLDVVEYAYFQLPRKIAGGTGACCLPNNGTVTCGGPVTQELCEDTLGGIYQGDGTDCAMVICPADIGACCLAGGTDCVALNEANCIGLDGEFRGIGTNCSEDGICDDPECGNSSAGDCFMPHVDPFCNDEECCELVCDLVPYCCDDELPFGWDDWCVATANLQCDDGNRCATFLAGPCFEAHPTGGCEDGACCDLVCAANPDCCDVIWNEDCVDLAIQLCVPPPTTGPTPNFVAWQGYLRSSTYNNQMGGAPIGLCGPAPNAPGFNGAGWSLFDETNNLEDNPNMSAPARYNGLYGLGRQLLDPPYNIGTVNGARGHGIRVGVIEWAFYKDHEDLNVTPEPGQTMIMIPSISAPEHATACAGIINCKANGFGMTGIAPDAKAYFFPITSAEEGPRELTAWFRCLQTLGAGDVISCSYGPATNLNNDPSTHPLIQLASDLGIATCIAAANECLNLDDVDEVLPDNGGIVVGACFPGAPYCRLDFSNYDDGAPNVGNANRVYMAAWGRCVAAPAGSANLFFPSGNWNRSYCNDFSGTSSATPQIAGLAACLQGLAKQFYGIPLQPAQIRGLMQTGAAQCGVPDPADLPGFDPDLGCGYDLDPDQDPKLIGPYPNPRSAGDSMFSQTIGGFDESPLVDDIVILRGTLKHGNKFSVKANEQNYLVVQTKYTTRKMHPDIPGPASQAGYIGNGQVFDVMVKAHSNIIGTNTIAIDTNVQFPGQTSIWMIEMYDWDANRWNFIDVRTLDGVTSVCPDGDHCYVSVVTAAQRYINPTNKQILVRIYGTVLGFQDVRSSPAAGLFNGRIDWVNVRVSTGFGVVNGTDGTDPGSPTD